MTSSGRKRGSNRVHARISTRNKPPRIPRPHDEIRSVQRGLSERMQRTSLRQRTVVIAQYGWEISIVRAVGCEVGTAFKPRRRLPQKPISSFPLGRAHDTLQP